VALPKYELNPFPAETIVNLRYTIGIGFTVDATTSNLVGGTVTFQPNSAFEPLDTYAPQPYGFDQMAALYAKYKVLAFTLELEADPSGTASVTFCQILSLLYQPPSGGVTLAGANGALTAARPNVATVFMGNALSNRPASYRRYMPMQDILGVSKQEFDSNVEEYAAAVAANPVQMPTIQIGLSTVTSQGAASGANAMVLFTLTQRVQFFGRISQALS
jgi:hypothetical protein